MKIGILGFTVTHENMGCQALTCAFLEMLRNTIPDIPKHIVVFRNDQTLGYIPELFPEMSFSLVPTTFHDIKLRMINEIRSCDVVFDETFGDGFSDIYFTKSVYRDTLIKLVAACSKCKFVLTPQTYGPFKSKKLEWLAGKAISKADKVYARDKMSADYAHKISGTDVITVTDLAFSLPFNKSLSDSDKKRFGLNISGLLWKGGFSSDNQFGLLTNYRDYCDKLIEELGNQGMEIHLIPHVTYSLDNKNEIPDGDYPYCQELHEMHPETILAPNFRTPYDAKDYIASMDYFSGARMHSTIAAFSSDVVTIPFAYSRKFQGLYGNLHYPFIVDGTKLNTEDAIKLTLKYVSNKDELKQAQKRSFMDVEKNTSIFKKELECIIQSLA